MEVVLGKVDFLFHFGHELTGGISKRAELFR